MAAQCVRYRRSLLPPRLNGSTVCDDGAAEGIMHKCCAIQVNLYLFTFKEAYSVTLAPCCGPTLLAGAWLRAEESEIGVHWLGKDFTYC